MTQRIILFRGKRIDNGEWVEGSLGYNSRYRTYHITVHNRPTIPSDMSVEVDPATVGQFTGNEDTNGTMVWEGSTIENCDTKDLQEVYWNLNESAWYCRYIGQNRIVSLADSLGNLNTVIK